MAESNVVTVRTVLAHFRTTLETARQTGEPVIIALRRRQPAGVLLGYEAWKAGQAELIAERQRNDALATDLTAAQQQIEEVRRDLSAAHQRVAALEAQLARLQPTAPTGVGWSRAPQPEPPGTPLDTWGGQARGSSDFQKSQI